VKVYHKGEELKEYKRLNAALVNDKVDFDTNLRTLPAMDGRPSEPVQ